MPTDLAKLRAFAGEIRALLESAGVLTFKTPEATAAYLQAIDQLADAAVFLEAFVAALQPN